MNLSRSPLLSMFQPTLPLRGATLGRSSMVRRERGFNPRSPCGERRAPGRATRPGRGFNPRSPCGERPSPRPTYRPMRRFNPRSPCGERLTTCVSVPASVVFQPTLPLRGATQHHPLILTVPQVSTHAPLAGSDRAPEKECPAGGGFNPRSPCGERRRRPGTTWQRLWIVSTHAPLAGSDARRTCRAARATRFNPRSPCGERPG